MNVIFVWLIGWGAGVLALAVFAVLFATCEIGFQIGRRRAAGGPGHEVDKVTPVLTSGMLTLLAFILGLTVNFAQNRYEARRELIITEANAIGTAWLRARLVGGADGEALADDLRQYAQTRLDFAHARLGAPSDALVVRTAAESEAIWRLTAKLARAAPTPITATLVGAVNTMIDSAQAQRFAFLGEAPAVTLDLMTLGSVLAIGALGFQMGLHGVRHPILSALLLVLWTACMVVAVDLGRPRLGLVRVDTRPLEWTIHDMRAAGPPTPLVAPAAVTP